MAVITLLWKDRRREAFMKKWFLHKPVVFSAKASRQWQESFTLFTSTVRNVFRRQIKTNADSLGVAVALTPNPSPPRIQLHSSILLRRRSLLIPLFLTSSYRHSPFFDLHTPLSRLSLMCRTHIIIGKSPMDEPFPTASSAAHFDQPRSNILATGISSAAGDITLTGSERGNIRCRNLDCVRISEFERLVDLLAVRGDSHRARCVRDGTARSGGAHTRLEVSRSIF